MSARDLTLRRRAETTARRFPLQTGAALVVYVMLISFVYLWGSELARSGETIVLGTPPLFGGFDPRLSFRILPAVAIAALVVAFGHRASAALSWRTVMALSYAGAAVWAVALAIADGWGALVAPILNPLDAYSFVPRMGNATEFLRTFTSRIETLPIHVQSHPPGLPLLLHLLDLMGLARPGMVAAIYVAIGAAVVPAVLVAAKAVSGEGLARSAAPWLTLAPYAVWIATSADALYAGVAAWGVALIVSAQAGKELRALTGGLVFAGALFLTYGAAALALVPVVVTIARRSFKPLIYAACGVAGVMAAFGFFGFWWLDGLKAAKIQYFAGLGGLRPYTFFLVANLAALAIACGPAALRGLMAWRSGFGGSAVYLVTAALMAVAAADLSGLSKGEVERIWLLFMPWILIAAAFIVRGRRLWLGASAASAILVQILVLSPW